MAVETAAPEVEEHIGLPGGAISFPCDRKLWELSELMEEFDLCSFYSLLSLLRSRTSELKSQTIVLSERERERLKDLLRDLVLGFRRIFNERTRDQMISILGRVNNESLTPQFLAIQLGDLLLSIETDLSKMTFVYVPEQRASYLEQSHLFGVKVHDAFPSARDEIKEAGNCFAAGLFTASVFHSMRATEVALRALARHVDVSIPDIDYEEWNSLITNIQIEAEKICNALPGRRAKAEARDFYNGACGEFRAFKDAWRNHVMHTRAAYDQHQAISVLNHVGEFMRRLAEKIAE